MGKGRVKSKLPFFFQRGNMSFFKKIGKAVSKAAKPIIKDAVPLGAAYLTGGASLSVMPPSNVMGSLFGSGAAETVQEVQDTVQPYVDQYQQLSAQLPSRQINSQLQVPADYEKPARTASEVKSSYLDDSSKKYLIFGGIGFAALMALLLILKRQ